jgi:23S rRNA (pseudouridine1915-N3)-methyltransferase
MKIRIVTVGQRQPKWVDAAVDDYLGRFPADFKVEIREVKAEPRGAKQAVPVARLLAAEARRIIDAAQGPLLIALDERGRDLTSRQFADELQRLRDGGEAATFVIGGPDGLDESIKQASRFTLRLSAMTLPHSIARVVLLEQIYRAWSLLANHPYHRA